MVGVATIILGSVMGWQPSNGVPLYMSEADVRSTIEGAWELFGTCEALIEEGSSPPPHTVSFVIGRDGVVTGAGLTSPEGSVSEYSSCLVQQLSEIAFPNHWENPIALRYVFTWGAQGLIRYPRVPLPERLSLPLGLGFFGVSTEALFDLLFEGGAANDSIE